MPELTVEEQNEIARARHITERRELRNAFVAVFGPPGEPTPPAQLVLAYLDDYSGRHNFRAALDLQGRTDVERTFMRLGIRDVVDEIHRKLNWKESDYADSRGGP